jgi:hypothetical protein
VRGALSRGWVEASTLNNVSCMWRARLTFCIVNTREKHNVPKRCNVSTGRGEISFNSVVALGVVFTTRILFAELRVDEETVSALCGVVEVSG